MALVVEDGTGLPNADSYLSIVDADAYHASHGAPVAWTGDKETALRRATQYLDAVYGQRWKGTRLEDDQALDWARDDVEVDSVILDAAPLPRALKEACAELALRHLTEASGLLPDVDTERDVASESVDVGPISVSTSYAGAKPTYKRFSIVEALLRRLLLPAGRLVRI